MQKNLTESKNQIYFHSIFFSGMPAGLSTQRRGRILGFLALWRKMRKEAAAIHGEEDAVTLVGLVASFAPA